MNIAILAGLMLGSSVQAPDVHHSRIDHRGASVDVTHRSDVRVEHRQVGSVGPGGRSSSLRCAWSAKMVVHREARSSSGSMLTRTIGSETPLTGSRPGWCSSQRSAIASDVSARSDRLRDHLLAVAEQDHDSLRAELDALHGPSRS